MGMLHQNDAGVRISLQFEAQYSAFGVNINNNNTKSFTFSLDSMENV